MKFVNFWARREVKKLREKLDLGAVPPEKRDEKTVQFIEENRKRIQDLELVVKELITWTKTNS